MSTPGWQAEDETESRVRAQAPSSQVLVPKPKDSNEGAHVSNTIHLTLFPSLWLIYIIMTVNPKICVIRSIHFVNVCDFL